MNLKYFLFGAAYYAEYMPCPRTAKDMRLIKQAGMNVIRIAESTWSTWEPRENEFDFSTLHEMLNAAETEGLQVIIGTPTYAIPSWLEKKYPEIMAENSTGRLPYGHRQLFDLTNPDYLRYAERIIRRLMEECAGHPSVIGFQLDNETHTAGDLSPDNQKRFVAQLREKYPDIREFNREFGLDYWSNRVDDWGAFPDVRGTINGSLSAAYKRYLREEVTKFLHWQAGIVREYMRPGQMITHNFDYSWEECSVGLQPLVDQKEAAECMDIAGCDIYHRMQDDLDGATIAFGGAVARSLKKDNYIVLETEAQGRVGWLPYPGQLRLSAYSHLANGASGILYWNWHSIHNAIESYWKGVLSHDLTPGAIYEELSSFRREMQPLEKKLINLKKENRAAILVNRQSLVGLDEFPVSDAEPDRYSYNHLLRQMADACHRLNLEYDLVYPEDELSGYSLLMAPSLYSADEELIGKLRKYVSDGGHLFMTCRSCFADDELKIYHDAQPHGLTDVFGMTYDRFTIPRNVGLRLISASDGDSLKPEDKNMGRAEDIIFPTEGWMELLRPATAETKAVYDHPVWKNAALCQNRFGDGTATYLGCITDLAGLTAIIKELAAKAGISLYAAFPLIRKTGINSEGNRITYYLNYSSAASAFLYEGNGGKILLDSPSSGQEHSGAPASIQKGDSITVAPWDLIIIEEKP